MFFTPLTFPEENTGFLQTHQWKQEITDLLLLEELVLPNSSVQKTLTDRWLCQAGAGSCLLLGPLPDPQPPDQDSRRLGRSPLPTFSSGFLRVQCFCFFDKRTSTQMC